MSRTLLNRCSALWVAGVAAIAKLVQDEGEVKSYQEQYECVEQLSSSAACSAQPCISSFGCTLEWRS